MIGEEVGFTITDVSPQPQRAVRSTPTDRAARADQDREEGRRAHAQMELSGTAPEQLAVGLQLRISRQEATRMVSGIQSHVPPHNHKGRNYRTRPLKTSSAKKSEAHQAAPSTQRKSRKCENCRYLLNEPVAWRGLKVARVYLTGKVEEGSGVTLEEGKAEHRLQSPVRAKKREENTGTGTGTGTKTETMSIRAITETRHREEDMETKQKKSLASGFGRSG